MSVLPFGISLLSAAAEGLIGPIIVRQRNIGGFVADVTVRESHRDTLRVSENPVEQGADVTDHAIKLPPDLVIEVGYSNSSPASGGDPNYVQSVYDAFLVLQASRQPFDVVTGKRIYDNMLMTEIETVTDEKTENALFLRVALKNIIIVQTQTVSVPPTANMANPGVNGAPQAQGFQSLQPGSNFNYAAAPTSAPFGNLQ